MQILLMYNPLNQNVFIKNMYPNQQIMNKNLFLIKLIF